MSLSDRLKNAMNSDCMKIYSVSSTSKMISFRVVIIAYSIVSRVHVDYEYCRSHRWRQYCIDWHGEFVDSVNEQMKLVKHLYHCL